MVDLLRITIGLLIIASCFYGSSELSLLLFGKDGVLGQFMLMMTGLIVGLFIGLRVILGGDCRK